MKASELRIGNYVNYKYNELEFDKVEGIDSEYVYLETITYDDVCHDDVEPIPLTKEWLIKFGFELKHVPFDSYWENEEIEYKVRETNGKFAFCVEDYEDGKTIAFLMHTDKVHTFQNNAFALNGKELKQI